MFSTCSAEVITIFIQVIILNHVTKNDFLEFFATFDIVNFEIFFCGPVTVDVASTFLPKNTHQGENNAALAFRGFIFTVIKFQKFC